MKKLILTFIMYWTVLNSGSYVQAKDGLKEFYGTVKDSAGSHYMKTIREPAPDTGDFIVHNLEINYLFQVIDTQYTFKDNPYANCYWTSKEVNPVKDNFLIYWLIILTCVCFLLGFFTPIGLPLKFAIIAVLYATSVIITTTDGSPYTAHLAERITYLHSVIFLAITYSVTAIGHSLRRRVYPSKETEIENK